MDAGFLCPNRDGKKGRGGCIYCDSKGSGTGAFAKGLSVAEQMSRGMEWARRRYKARLFIAYFQAFSNTYGDLDHLKSQYLQALCSDEVVGIAIGTRPDCVDEDKLDMIRNIAEGRMVWMEYGLQSASNTTLRLLNRHCTVEDFISAVKMTKSRGMLTCAHVIFGLPGEGYKEMKDTVELLCDLKVEGVKFHQLYILKGSKLEEMYKHGGYEPISLEDYTSMVAESINMLSKDTVIQRISADPPRDTLVSPKWSLEKINIRQLIWEKLSGSGIRE